jgi:hypothetical protein
MIYFRKMRIALALVFFIVATSMLGMTSMLYADDGIPYTFSPGETISASQVNANFQALLTRIRVLEAQLAPVSIVGTYDYVAMDTRMSTSGGDYNYRYDFMGSGERGTVAFYANGTFSVNPNSGGWSQLTIFNEISAVVENTVLYNGDPPTISSPKRDKSLISSIFSQGGTEAGTSTYSISGSIVTMGNGIIGALSGDGRTLIFSSFNSAAKKTGLMVAIKRQ